jgi:hypothetical protein
MDAAGAFFDAGRRILRRGTLIAMADTDLRLFAATSGWEGPFQHEQVIVAAGDAEAARILAEEAFADVRQPVCRTKMRIADLGPIAAGVVVGPLKAGDSLAAAGDPVDLRCGPLEGGD